MSKKEKESYLYAGIRIAILVVLGLLIWFFINVKYEVSLILTFILSAVFVLSSNYLWKKGFFHFFIFALVSISSFIALEVSFELGFYINFLCAAVLSLLVSWMYIKKETNERYAYLLLFSFAVIWIINGFNVSDRTDWILENSINIPFVIITVLISRWFRFSKLSYSLFFVYMFMNIVGSHYTYANVPFGYWLEGFFGLSRNHYDRIIHFLFGFLLAYPMREIYVRIGNHKGFWALAAPIIMVFGLSAVYEILEWWVAVVFGGDLGVAYLGSQGDIWDAQEDMFLAGFGSILAMFITMVVLIIKNKKSFFREFVESLRVKEKKELGEVALEKIDKKQRK